MRRGTSGAAIRRTADGRLESVNLGADYCAEHEWGIRRLEEDFGLDPKAKPGIPRRKISKVPDTFHLRLKHEKDSSLVIHEPYTLGTQGYVPSELDFYDRRAPGSDVPLDELVGAWSEQDFGVRFRNKQ